MLRFVLAAFLFGLTAIPAQGLLVKAEAHVLFGIATKCSQPAYVDFNKLKKLTPEWKLIRSEGVRRGSARYDLLTEDLNKRIKKIVVEIAKTTGKDCVLCKGDVEDANGLTLIDLTEQVATKLESKR